VDQLYFESYSYFDIHREMLGDKVRWLKGGWEERVCRVGSGGFMVWLLWVGTNLALVLVAKRRWKSCGHDRAVHVRPIGTVSGTLCV
jgi:hypothetical protein